MELPRQLSRHESEQPVWKRGDRGPRGRRKGCLFHDRQWRCQRLRVRHHSAIQYGDRPYDHGARVYRWRDTGPPAFEGFTQVGNQLYFNTFTGGNATTTGQTPASGNGAGTLSVLDVTTSGSEALSTLALLPLGDGSTRLPAHNPFYSAAQNALFFTTVGTLPSQAACRSLISPPAPSSLSTK